MRRSKRSSGDKGAGGKQKGGKKRGGGSVGIFADDEKMMKFVKKVVVGGLLFFVVAAVLIVTIKRSKTKLISPQDIVMQYVLTARGLTCLAVGAAVVFGKPILYRHLEERERENAKREAESTKRKKDKQRSMEYLERKQRSDEIDLKHSTVATNVAPVAMRTRVKHGGGQTHRVEKMDGDGDEEDAESGLFNFWNSFGKKQDKERASAAYDYEEDDGEEIIEDSETYLAQEKDRTPLDLEDRPSGIVEASTVKVTLDLTVRWKMSTLRVDSLKCLIGCNRCDYQTSTRVSGQWKQEARSRLRCKKCSQIMGLQIRPTLVHQNSSLVCRLVTENSVCMDIMDGSTFIAACEGCGMETVMPPMRRKVRVERSCRKCHHKLALTVKQVALEGGSSGSRPRKTGRLEKNSKGSKTRHHVLKPGEPLPLQGACEHFEKSFRWYRFPCCGGAFPCPVCHAASGCKEPDTFANVMICGMCSEEMGFSDSKPCRKCGFEFGMGGVSQKKHLQKVTLAQQKAMAPGKKKTTSKKKHRVGALGKHNAKAKTRTKV